MTQWLSELVQRTGCGMLLDVGHLYAHCLIEKRDLLDENWELVVEVHRSQVVLFIKNTEKIMRRCCSSNSTGSVATVRTCFAKGNKSQLFAMNVKGVLRTGRSYARCDSTSSRTTICKSTIELS